jgi:quercetin dioxygenase-like cupin family protein
MDPNTRTRATGALPLRARSGNTQRYAILLLSIDDPTNREGPMTDGLAVRSDEGEARWWLGALAIIKATAADTGGSLTLLDVTDPPGVKAPLHVHHREDEAFWVLEGEVTFEVGGKRIEASAGDIVFGPRDIPHRYEVGEAGSRMLFALTPGGFEDLVRATSEPARTRTLPPADHPMPDEEQMMAAQAAAGCDLVG